MFCQESKEKLKEVLVLTAETEVAIEKMRQELCKMEDFEPYTAFRRIDRKNAGLIDRFSLC